MATKNFNSQSQFQLHIAELIANGKTPKAAEKIARRERRLASPLHKAAAARRWASAQDRRAAFEVRA